jgi:hypothetical protein
LSGEFFFELVLVEIERRDLVLGHELEEADLGNLGYLGSFGEAQSALTDFFYQPK